MSRELTLSRPQWIGRARVCLPTQPFQETVPWPIRNQPRRAAFQEIILRLQSLLGGAGAARCCSPMTWRSGRGRSTRRRRCEAIGDEALGCGLCAAVAPPDRRALRREPEPAAALLSVPGDHQTLAPRPAGAVPRLAGRRSGSIWRCMTSALSRMTGKARRWVPGVWGGRSGATGWRSASSPISSRSAGHDCHPVSGELTYGLERLAMYVMGVDHVMDMPFNDPLKARSR